MPNYQLFEIYKNEEKVKFVKNWKMDIFKNLEFDFELNYKRYIIL
jgi:hypothetical protein